MSDGDKIEHKTEEFKGKAKETLGEVTGNEQWQAEGKAEQTKGDLKQAGEKVKDSLTSDDDTNNWDSSWGVPVRVLPPHEPPLVSCDAGAGMTEMCAALPR